MIRRMSKLGLVLVLPVLLLSASPVKAAPLVDEVAQKLICQCGCLMVLNNCSHGECGSRETMLGIIKQNMADGMPSDQIVQSFVRMYGEKVLAEPTKKGFNLTAWLFPFVGLAVGALVVYISLKKWVHRQEPEVKEAQEPREGDDKYRLQLEQDLKDFAERGFR